MSEFDCDEKQTLSWRRGSVAGWRGRPPDVCTADQPRVVGVLANRSSARCWPGDMGRREGFFGNVVFTNGHVVRGDEILLYYGAADTVVCGAKFSITEIMSKLS